MNPAKKNSGAALNNLIGNTNRILWKLMLWQPAFLKLRKASRTPFLLNVLLFLLLIALLFIMTYGSYRRQTD